VKKEKGKETPNLRMRVVVMKLPGMVKAQAR